MPDPYKILTIDPKWERRLEQMGSKKKFWFARRTKEEQKNWWLFKYPKKNTGEHWAEKIVAEVADFLKIIHAQVQLATSNGEQGSATESFARGGRSLWHGNQILANVVQEYDSEKRFGQSSHTLANIWQALDIIFIGENAAQKYKLVIAEYIVLDTLVGNVDRHHENWGILRRRVQGQWQGRIAPTFDHASSLGRELLDERRRRFLEENRVGDYSEKGRGGIYWSEDNGQHGPSPLELVRRAFDTYRNLFRPAIDKLRILDDCSIWNIIEKIPDDWMTPLSRQFAHQLMLYNLKELRRLTE